MRLARSLAAFAMLAVTVPLLAGSGRNSFPGEPGEDPWMHRPNDPEYESDWQFFSHIPYDHVGEVSPWEESIGSGMHVDRAWQLHTGTFDTTVAILDSGIHWDEEDLVERYRINHGELPKPHGSEVYDRNGDGRFSVGDYESDPRVHDANGNGLLDPGDLIAIFSDGVDDDGNGYIDDIAGWDFHEGDNNPGDRTDFGHGTGEARDSVATINNGNDGAGVCGHCSFIALRVDDSFVVDANAFARAVIYAVDEDADLVQQALGSVNATPLSRHAVEYAYENDVVVIGSAADENSYHHNYPSTFDPVVYTNAIRYDTREPENASTFVNFNNCSNFGARVDVATSGRSCSSEATGNLSGISALAVSYAKERGTPLSAGELISLIKNSATDIDRGSNENDPFRHSTYEGWDTITGYGRTHAYDMLAAIRDERIPPEARITSPEWFALHRKKHTERIPVEVDVSLPRSGLMKLTLEVAKGVETSGAEFVTLKQSKTLREAVDGVFASVSRKTLEALPTGERDHPRNRHAFTLRLTVEDLQGQSAEARRTFFLFEDERLLSGFPQSLRGSGESSGVFVDLDRDGADEYVTADGAGWIHAFKASGREKSGFPVAVAPSRHGRDDAAAHASVFAPVAAGDLTGDGRAEVVAVTLEGHLTALDADGTPLPGFPVELPFPDMEEVNRHQVIAAGVMAAPVLTDLSADGKTDIIVMGLDGQVHAYGADGKPLRGFPVPVTAGGVRAKILSSPAVFDITGDGRPELIFGTNHFDEETGSLFAVNGRGNLAKQTLLEGFPTHLPVLRDKVLPTVGTGVPTAPAVADADGDGHLEILVHGFVGKAYLFNAKGGIDQGLTMELSSRHDANDEYMLPAFGHPAFGDVTGDGVSDPVTVGVGKRMLVSLLLGGKRFPFDHMVGAWDGASGTMLEGFPKVLDDMALATSPLVVDLDQDMVGEVIASSGGYFVHAWDETRAVEGFPHFTGGWVLGSPSVGDMDGDGKLELAVTTREGNLLVWKTDASAADAARLDRWPTFKGNPERTGRR